MQTAYPTKYPMNLFYWDPIECLQSLMNHPLLKNALQFELLCVFKTTEKLMCIYSEWRMGDVTWKMQVHDSILCSERITLTLTQSQLPDGATLLGTIIKPISRH